MRSTRDIGAVKFELDYQYHINNDLLQIFETLSNYAINSKINLREQELENNLAMEAGYIMEVLEHLENFVALFDHAKLAFSNDLLQKSFVLHILSKTKADTELLKGCDLSSMSNIRVPETAEQEVTLRFEAFNYSNGQLIKLYKLFPLIYSNHNQLYTTDIGYYTRTNSYGKFDNEVIIEIDDAVINGFKSCINPAIERFIDPNSCIGYNLNTTEDDSKCSTKETQNAEIFEVAFHNLVLRNAAITIIEKCPPNFEYHTVSADKTKLIPYKCGCSYAFRKKNFYRQINLQICAGNETSVIEVSYSPLKTKDFFKDNEIMLKSLREIENFSIPSFSHGANQLRLEFVVLLAKEQHKMELKYNQTLKLLESQKHDFPDIFNIMQNADSTIHKLLWFAVFAAILILVCICAPALITAACKLGQQVHDLFSTVGYIRVANNAPL